MFTSVQGLHKVRNSFYYLFSYAFTTCKSDTVYFQKFNSLLTNRIVLLNVHVEKTSIHED